MLHEDVHERFIVHHEDGFGRVLAHPQSIKKV
jgi:hypothetical protein